MNIFSFRNCRKRNLFGGVLLIGSIRWLTLSNWHMTAHTVLTNTTSVSSGALTRGTTLLADNGSIEKPLLDNRSYRFVKLNGNNLHALLIHDPTTDKSAASLDVNVGSFADSEYDIPGLAHFCEHLLFMGTKKYPQENEYSSYLSKHSGHSNAYTASEHTNYYFEVDSKFLQGALDRFGQFFIDPLFSKSCKDREIKAVDLENKKNLQSDTWRMYQLDRLLSNKKHPYNGFSTGNLETLHETPTAAGLDVREVLMSFHQLHYSSNIMSLVVLGKESLDELESWTSEIFSQVPNKDLARPNYKGEVIYEKQDLLKLIQAKPVLESNKLELSFMIPDDQENNWDSKPSSYFSHLIGHEGKGSLLHYLKGKGWVNELHVGNMPVCQGSSVFGIEAELTTEGLKHWEEIVVSAFQYLNLIKLSGPPQKWIFDEISKMSEVNFKFKQKQGAASTVSRLSSKLIKYFEDGVVPSTFILSLGILREFDEGKITEFGDYLNCDNFRVSLSSQDLPDSTFDSKERWYGTEYSNTELSPELIKKLQNPGLNDELHFPISNDFIPTNFDISLEKSDSPLKHPYLVEDGNKFQVWYKQDDQYEVPKGTIEAIIHLPNSSSSLKSSLYTSIWLDIIEDELNEIAYYASIVGLNYLIQPWRDGILLRVSGYNDKLKVLVEKVLNKIITLKPKQDRFEILKEKFRQELKNFGYAVPYNQMASHFLVLMNDNTYTNESRLELIQQAGEISFEGLEEFLRETVWSSGVFGEVLVQGNFKLEACKEISSIFNETFKDIKEIGNSTEEINQVVKYQSHVLNEGSIAKYELPLMDADNINSCIDYYIQVGNMSDEKLRVLNDLFSTVINEPCFNQLRTKEQLGYVVFLGPKVTRTNFGFRVLIQSERTTDYLEYRIEEFLSKFGKFIHSGLSEDNFNNYKQALKDKKLTKLKNLKEEVSRFWGAITDGYYDFQLKEKQVKILETITLSEFQDFFTRHIDIVNSKSGRVIVHLKSQSPTVPPKEKLIHSSIINFLYRHDLTLGSDTLDSILKETDGDLKKLSKEITDALINYTPGEQDDDSKKNEILDENKFSQELAETISREIDQPVPSKYPQGVNIESAVIFKKNTKMGGIPVPVEPLSNFYLPRIEESEVHL